MAQRTGTLLKWVAVIVLGLIAALVAFAFWQGRKTPAGEPIYVALGSSFAAGAGLGSVQDGSPLLCARSSNSYPQQLARTLRLPIVDMSCGGASTKHVLSGGQFFQGPQIRVIDKRTRLVTITVGGNDIGYIGDLSMLAGRNTKTVFGRLVRAFWGGPKSVEQRNYAKLQDQLSATIRAIHARAPEALVVVVTYPRILPASGTCSRLALSSAELGEMREVADRLANVTRAAAEQGGALLVDMNRSGLGHDACSAEPWTRGWSNGGVAPFHPTLSGARATAAAIAHALGRSPAGIAAVSEDDAPGHQTGSVGRQEQNH